MLKRAFVRTVVAGLLTLAVVPPAAVYLSRPAPTKQIVLRMTMEPVSDNPMLSAAR